MLAFYRENARWLLGGFLLTFFSGFGQTFFISIWGAQIRSEFELSHGGFGSVYMLATLASALSLPLVGRLVDKTSVALCSVIVISMLAVATTSMALVTSVPLLVITIYLLRLFGQGMMGHTALTAMGRWYSANRGKAVASTSIGHQLSEGIGPTIFVALGVYLGWRGTWFAATAILLLVALPVVFMLMKEERIPRSQIGTTTHNDELGKQWLRSEVLRDPMFWLMSMGVLSPAFIGTSIWFHQDYLIELNGWSKLMWANSFALMAVTTVAGALITGFAIDRWSAIQLLPIFMVPLSIACMILGTLDVVGAIYASMIFIGLSYGVSSSLFGALWPEIYGVRHLGSIRSLIMAFMVFFSAAGPGVTGMLIDRSITFPLQLQFISVYCFAAAILMLFVSRTLFARRKIECGGAIKR